mgnify:FL=1
MQDLLLSADDIKSIAKLFGQEPEKNGNTYAWNFKGSDDSQHNIYFAIHTGINLLGRTISIVSVQTIYGYYELHNIQRWEILLSDEVFFFTETNDEISCLSISKNNGVSIFANLSKDILSIDITEVDPSLLLSTLQLSIFDSKNICQ